jgi:NADH-quinone oxidoreductase subunit L
MLFGTDVMGHAKQLPFFLGAIEVLPENDVVAALGAQLWHGPVAFALHGFKAPAFWLALMGFLLATLLYLVKPEWRAGINRTLALPIRVLENKYWMDDLWIGGLAGGGLGLGKLSRLFDSKVIDGVAVNGSAGLVGLAAGLVRKLQSGYLYHYAFAMILGLVALLALANLYWL